MTFSNPVIHPNSFFRNEISRLRGVVHGRDPLAEFVVKANRGRAPGRRLRRRAADGVPHDRVRVCRLVHPERTRGPVSPNSAAPREGRRGDRRPAPEAGVQVKPAVAATPRMNKTCTRFSTVHRPSMVDSFRVHRFADTLRGRGQRRTRPEAAILDSPVPDVRSPDAHRPSRYARNDLFLPAVPRHDRVSRTGTKLSRQRTR